MKILVYPHTLSIGGSQLNAIELAGAVAGRGHDVTVFGRPGPLVDVVRAWGLHFERAPESKRRPSLAVADALVRLVDRDGYDVVHGYEWPPVLEAFYGPGLRRGTSVVATILSMSVPAFLPNAVPLIVGTRQIKAVAEDARGTPVWVVEPPVDVAENAPNTHRDVFRRQHDLDATRPLVVIVSRLANELKLEGLERAIAAAGQLDGRCPFQLVIVGDGPARAHLEGLAAAMNQRLQRRAVVLTGELFDPRPAYSAADVVLGMGGSALRAMAFAKPVIVLGEGGFALTLDDVSVETFRWQGFYGIGGGHDLAAALADLLPNPDLRRRLGEFSRRTVVEEFSLTRAAATLEAIYQEPRIDSASGRLKAGMISGVRLGLYKVRRRIARSLGRAPTEDSNARAVLERVQNRKPDEAAGRTSTSVTRVSVNQAQKVA
jgi:glycosyltransferase involved in cell wall biosynthesis